MWQIWTTKAVSYTHLESKLDWAEAMAETSTSPEEALSQQRPTDAASVLASACYICLKYPGDYDRGIVAAVNHSGLSSALGAVAGALLGAQVGTEGIPEFYLEPLEFREILTELASDLLQGCPMSRNARLFDDCLLYTSIYRVGGSRDQRRSSIQAPTRSNAQPSMGKNITEQEGRGTETKSSRYRAAS